jgi:hypothetical protein
MEITIKKNKEDKVLEFANNAISFFEPNSTTLKGINFHKFDQYIYALSNLIEIQDFKNFEEKRSLIIKAINKSNGSPLNSEDFENILINIRKEVLNKKKEIFYFVFPLKIKYKSIKKRHFTLLNTKIKVHSYNYLRKNFDLDVLIEDAQLFKDEKIEASLKSSLSYFIIEEKAINVHKGKNSTFNKIELLRSIINFTYQYRILHFSNYEPKPLSLIHPPKAFFAFDSNRKYLENWKTVYTYDSKEIDFANGNLRNKEVIKRAEKHIKKINSINKGNFRNLIIATFYLHNYGLDHHYKPFLSFLNFWQIFELISLNSKQEYVSKRMLSLLKEKNPYADIIDVFRQKRNEFIHKGKINDIAANDINMIIGIAQEAMMFLIYNEKQIKNINGLNLFYDNINNSDEDFKKKMDILRYIQKIKG